mmetsp:Transcript_93071/g.299533  ORF Transcript_93071/g.299533 Transcript_93071/m.299533 type:complete len:208 (+) Transcript_93071:619-1242(+)
MYSGMSKEEWRANMSMVQLAALPLKAYILFVRQGLWDSSRWPLYTTSAVSAIAAVPLGNWVAARIDQEKFRQIITCFLFFGALQLATHGTGLVSALIVWALAGVGLLYLFAKWFCRRRPAGPPPASPEESCSGDSGCTEMVDAAGGGAGGDDDTEKWAGIVPEPVRLGAGTGGTDAFSRQTKSQAGARCFCLGLFPVSNARYITPSP